MKPVFLKPSFYYKNLAPQLNGKNFEPLQINIPL